jgi:hypothetical protein
MEATISAILGELASRSVSFLVDKYLKRAAAPTEEESASSLQRLLLRVRVIVEEAEERRITNQAMLYQLSVLRKEMYRGYYTLDMCRCRGGADEDQVSRHAFTLSTISNPAKRLCFHGGSSQSTVKELQQVLGSLEAVVSDLNEFVVLLGSCPRLCRQPYSMHLILDRCMFGRQVEMERVISFLLQQPRRWAGSTCSTEQGPQFSGAPNLAQPSSIFILTYCCLLMRPRPRGARSDQAIDHFPQANT